MNELRIRAGMAALVLAAALSAVPGLRGATAAAGQAIAYGQASPHGQEPEAEASMDEHIEQWIQALAETEPFAEWLGASWDKQPLGPGTHAWVVVLSREGRDIGYLVVEALADGDYRLGEYGSGDYPLFGTNALYRELVRHGIYSYTSIDRWYQDGLHALWIVRTADSDTPILLDARTAEWLPLESVPSAEEAPDTGAGGNPVPQDDSRQVIRSQQVESFDPYDDLSWLIDAPLDIDQAQSLIDTLEEAGRLTFVSKLYGKRITAPLAVTGYQEWSDGRLYIRLEQSGVRYLPWGGWISFGRFYG
ncbi:hypothetical protein ACFQWB_10155 [Paenibacillus thermoaerophilus]|uniref:Uncharacterized protein n=1 Tax=Paenibacillus thermoaerophilus TaxID=1215385 RepID=A0ABW2V4Y5_9BACL|nr:hypothetical protein [Paenibacillus thermoaerophilus]TMV18856.1 hypothetical protein FE781_02740 [Paenibacillus thermoaerophilus]